MSQHVRLPDPVYEAAKDIQDDGDYSSMGEAIRHVFVEAGYDV